MSSCHQKQAPETTSSIALPALPLTFESLQQPDIAQPNQTNQRNPVLAAEGIDYAAPPPGSVAAFQSTVRGYGLSVTVRQEKGQDISGACGQLVIDTAQQQLLLQGGGGGSGGGVVGAAGAAARDQQQRCGGSEKGGEGLTDIEELVAAAAVV